MEELLIAGAAPHIASADRRARRSHWITHA
jgi:hypothetical protein